jgi:addiction module HigA family antidote
MAYTNPPRVFNPPHPGRLLQDTVLKAGELTVSELARHLKIPRTALSRVVNGKAAVTADLALRLAAALGGTADSWLRMQASYDLWQASRKRRPTVEPLKNVARHATTIAAPRSLHGIRPFPRRGGVVTNELIDCLRTEEG